MFSRFAVVRPVRALALGALALISSAAHSFVSPGTLRWVPTSDTHLAEAEARMLECVRTPLKHLMVPLDDGTFVHTVVADAHDGSRPKPALVLVHGFGGGVGLWANNFDLLAEDFVVYAIDVIGFGRSSRPPFRGRTAADGREFFVKSLDMWRRAVQLDRFVLLGHSMGGYISAHYALRHPETVERLILAAPFGLAKPPKPVAPPPPSQPPVARTAAADLPLRYRLLRYFAERTSPQALVRLAGPFGPHVVQRLRGRYDGARYPYTDSRVTDYIFHLQAGSGSGEYAFMAMQEGFGFAKEPLFDEMHRLTMPVGFIYGTRDFITPSTAFAVRPSLRVPSDIHLIEGGAHHAYATHPEEFCAAVKRHALTLA